MVDLAASVDAANERAGALRTRAIDMALGRSDAHALDAFLGEERVGRALQAWFGDAASMLVAHGKRDALAQALARDIAALDEQISAQLNAILQHPRFRALESSWRGVQYLTTQAQDYERVLVRVLNAAWAEITRDLEKAVDFDQSSLFQRIYSDEFGMPGGQPYGILVVDHAVRHRSSADAPTDDVGALRALSQIAAASFAPTVLGASPRLLGLDDLAELGQPFDIETALRGAEYARWNAMRATEDARFVGIVLPRILLRQPYREADPRVEGFVYRAAAGPAEPGGGHLWGCGAFAFAAVAMRAFDRYGWFAEIRGVPRDQDDGGLVPGLVPHDFDTDAPHVAARRPVEVEVSDRFEKAFGDSGLITLVPCPYTDEIAFLGNASLHDAPHMGGPVAEVNARLSTMLQYVLCVSRFSHYVKVIARDRIGAYTTPAMIETYLADWLRNYSIGNDDASLDMKARYPLRETSVSIREIAGKPGSLSCIVHLRPHFQLDQVTSSFRLYTELTAPGQR
jgi:type VI secretion system protein ImpD